MSNECVEQTATVEETVRIGGLNRCNSDIRSRRHTLFKGCYSDRPLILSIQIFVGFEENEPDKKRGMVVAKGEGRFVKSCV